MVHEGGSNGGHYICYVKESNNFWYCYNDECRTQVSKEDINKDGIPTASTQACSVKYATAGTALPKPQTGTTNFNYGYGNRCWMNACFVYLNSFTSINNNMSIENDTLDKIIKEILNNGKEKAKQQNKKILAFRNGIKDLIYGSKNKDDHDTRADKILNKITGLNQCSDLENYTNQISKINKESIDAFLDRIEQQQTLSLTDFNNPQKLETNTKEIPGNSNNNTISINLDKSNSTLNPKTNSKLIITTPSTTIKNQNPPIQISRMGNDKKIKVATLKAAHTNNITNERLSILAQKIITNTIKSFQDTNIGADDVLNFINVMKEMITKNIDHGDINAAGKQTGFKAWREQIEDKLQDDNKEETIKKYNKISSQIQKEAVDVFDTIQGRKYGNNQQNGARSFRIIQMLNEGDLTAKYQQSSPQNL